VVENLVENLKFNFANASMTENVTFFGQKNHILVVENLVENLIFFCGGVGCVGGVGYVRHSTDCTCCDFLTPTILFEIKH
jgi:hypothetical protein